MLKFKIIHSKIRYASHANAKFIYEDSRIPIRICTEDLSWSYPYHVWMMENLHEARGGHYIQEGDVFYLNYEEPCFYK